jgi:hypothetical protein
MLLAMFKCREPLVPLCVTYTSLELIIWAERPLQKSG